jgi:hypothetical protein
LEKVASEQHGYDVLPAVVLSQDSAVLDASPLATQETFAPVLVVEIFDEVETAIQRHEAWKFGLTASIFTADADSLCSHRFSAFSGQSLSQPTHDIFPVHTALRRSVRRSRERSPRWSRLRAFCCAGTGDPVENLSHP